MKKERIIVAMSGGVDSSVAALLLHNSGYEVIGVTMRLWADNSDEPGVKNKRCCSVSDVQDAKRVCNTIGIPHYVMNFEKEFKKHVIDYFCQEYDRGRTPHPCLACNDKIKFDFLLKKALALDAKYIATGHYARIKESNGVFKLLKGQDDTKDQSYVLFTLTQKELSHLKFPIGEFNKADIRRLAKEAGLSVANKLDSMEICFIPDNDYRKFIAERLTPKSCNITDSSGNILGQHPGLQFFTIGQRRKLGLNGNSENPVYVTNIDPNTNTVEVGNEQALYKNQIWASKINFISNKNMDDELKVKAKIRYNSKAAYASVKILDDSWATINFDEPQKAITPGQAVVFYDDNELVGGGIVETKSPSRLTV